MSGKHGPSSAWQVAKMESPLGLLWLIASPLGLRNVHLNHIPDTEKANLGRLVARGRRAGGAAQDSEDAQQHLNEAGDQLREYFQGRRRSFSLALDLTGRGGGVQTRAQSALSLIPFGETRTYGEVASSIGRPRAARAVGTACAKNPLMIILPCHRVLPSDGSLGNYASGQDVKKALLELESA